MVFQLVIETRKSCIFRYFVMEYLEFGGLDSHLTKKNENGQNYGNYLRNLQIFMSLQHFHFWTLLSTKMNYLYENIQMSDCQSIDDKYLILFEHSNLKCKILKRCLRSNPFATFSSYFYKTFCIHGIMKIMNAGNSFRFFWSDELATFFVRWN